MDLRLPSRHVDVEDHKPLAAFLHMLVVRDCDWERSLLRIVDISKHTCPQGVCVCSRDLLHWPTLRRLKPVHLGCGERDDGKGETVPARLDQVHHLMSEGLSS